MTDMPLPRQSVISSLACSSTSSGSAAGPGAKLNTRTQRPRIYDKDYGQHGILTEQHSAPQARTTAPELQRADLFAAAVAARGAISTRGAVWVFVVVVAVDCGGIVTGLETGHALDTGQAFRLAQSYQPHPLCVAPDHADVGHRCAHQRARS